MSRLPARAVSACIALAVAGSACSVITEETSAEPASKTVGAVDRAVVAPPTTAAVVLGSVIEQPATTLQRLEMVGVPVGINLRNGPGIQYDVIRGYEKHRIVEATGETADGWIQVRIEGLTGWMVADHLQPTDRVDPGPDPTSTTTTTVATTSTVSEIGPLVVVGVPAGLNLRSGAGPDFEIVGGAPVGATVQATGNRADGWVEVTHDGVTGWASDRYLAAP